MTPSSIQQVFETVRNEMGKVIVGQDDLVEGVMLALFSHGHVLIEGPPGLGKTLLVNTLATVLDCSNRRVQCTPDLMPGDLVGHSVFDMKEQRFIYKQGPVFTNILLADEVNRATPKTQSAMLECLQERQVSIDGKTYPIEPPFVTLATQNPLEYEGTYPLPEAQVDRFMFKLLADYPSMAEETEILMRYQAGKDLFNMAAMGVQKVADKQTILTVIDSCTQVEVAHRVLEYIAAIVTKTREWPGISVGASPRASVALLMGARAAAAVRGRDYVTPDDVLRIAPWGLRHRIRLSPDSVIRGVQPDDVLAQLFDSIEVPRE
ncbi:MAG: MoxR family ATPase [Deltaproteobacteria bacterium]|nr:MoxR family ATPase [Deltaproteobacteria bacterium]MBN2671627.1 MoxR family ATPase [Deltaproteobacteria bacterium]